MNGKVYQVELESVEETSAFIKLDKTSEPTPQNQEGKIISSPMQGTIQKILVKPGQHIKKGASLLILEAMKLENDISADKDYLVLAVLVQEGDTVDSGQPLVKVE